MICLCWKTYSKTNPKFTINLLTFMEYLIKRRKDFLLDKKLLKKVVGLWEVYRLELNYFH